MLHPILQSKFFSRGLSHVRFLGIYSSNLQFFDSYMTSNFCHFCIYRSIHLANNSIQKHFENSGIRDKRIKKLNPFKVFQSDQMQRRSRKIFTAHDHYACRNAALNLTPVKGTTNGFIFQIINSLIGSWGVRLTCLDCKCKSILVYHLFQWKFSK